MLTYMLPFELLIRDIKTNDLTTSQSNSIKSKLLDTAFTSYSFMERKIPFSNLNVAESNTLQNLTKNKNLKLKTNIKHILSDFTNFKKFDIGENNQLNFLMKSEKKLKDIIKPLYQKGCLTKK